MAPTRTPTPLPLTVPPVARRTAATLSLGAGGTVAVIRWGEDARVEGGGFGGGPRREVAPAAGGARDGDDLADGAAGRVPHGGDAVAGAGGTVAVTRRGKSAGLGAVGPEDGPRPPRGAHPTSIVKRRNARAKDRRGGCG
ncbi:hypothetical protein Airi02_075050 [Actinoallomurus iriomotensis]|uniref:Uncharacterized protein n=1 Tax=Actinoallomurus iriomotensis TaxID=478107 RepID=A0A9W6S6N9_9ACTN|nr:hypothetical protein Airi02_075050 [Actinoallomurus iriomotensis]